MSRKKQVPPEPTPSTTVQYEKELALEEKEVQLEERKLAVWKLKFEFWRSAGRDVLILITGLAGTVGGGAIKAFLDYSEKQVPDQESSLEQVEASNIAPTAGGSSYPTLTPPDVLFGKGNGHGSAILHTQEASSPHRNKQVYMAGNALWGIFILLLVWGIWRRLRKGRVDGAPVEPGKPTSI